MKCKRISRPRGWNGKPTSPRGVKTRSLPGDSGTGGYGRMLYKGIESMKRLLFFLMAALACFSWSQQAHADYAFNFAGSAQASNGNTYTYDFTGNLTSLNTMPDRNGYVVVTGGTLIATGTAYHGIAFTVAPLSGSVSGYTASSAGFLNGYAMYTVRNTNGDDLFHDNVIAPGANPLLPGPQAGLDLLGTYHGKNIVISLSSAGADQYVIQSDNTKINDPYVTGWSYATLRNGIASAVPIPIPAALLLFAPGLAGLAALKRRYIG